MAVYRKRETDTQTFSGIIKSINLLLVFALPPTIALIIFGSLSVERDLDGVMAFTTLSLFNTLRLPLVILPKCIRAAAEAASAITRVEAFLLSADRKLTPKKATVGVSMTAASFTYGSAAKKLLENLTFEIKPGQLVMVRIRTVVTAVWIILSVRFCVLPSLCVHQPYWQVAGPVGSGKSNLLHAILGNMTLTDGACNVGGKFAYVPQTPWCQFGEPPHAGH